MVRHARTLMVFHCELRPPRGSERARCAPSSQDIMTRIDDVYMLEIDTRLDGEAMTSIWQTGHSRVPVYEKDVNNVCGVLFVKACTALVAWQWGPCGEAQRAGTRGHSFVQPPWHWKLPLTGGRAPLEPPMPKEEVGSGQGSIRMAVHHRRRGSTPPPPRPPPPDQSDHRGDK